MPLSLCSCAKSAQTPLAWGGRIWTRWMQQDLCQWGAKHYLNESLWKDYDVYDAFDVLGPRQS